MIKANMLNFKQLHFIHLLPVTLRWKQEKNKRLEK